MKPVASYLLALSLLLPFTAVQAKSVDDLYKAQVLVSSQSPAERKLALERALQQVLTKVSGQPAALIAPSLLKDAQRMAQQFSYARAPEATFGSEAGAPPQQLLAVSFQASAVDALLKTQRLPVWGAVRPEILVWMVEEQHGAREIVADDSSSLLEKRIKQLAQQRGLPIILPLMDVEDATHLNDSELWGLFEEPIAQASERYNPDVVLAGQAYRAPQGGYAGRWLLMLNDQAFHFKLEAQTKSDFLAQALDRLALELVSRYGVSNTQETAGHVIISVNNITRVEDYAALMAYLEGLNQVAELIPLSVEGEELSLRVNLAGGQAQFREVIALGSLLRERDQGDAAGPDALAYRWLAQ